MSFNSLNTKVNITFDCWTSPNHRSVMGVTAHWIDDNWKLWDLVVAAVEIEGDHSGQNLEQHLFNVLEEFNLLSKVFVSPATLLQRTAQLQRAWINGVSFLDSLEATTCSGVWLM